MMRGPVGRWIPLLATLASLAGCAPHLGPAPELPAAALRARFESGAAARRSGGAGVEAELSMWLETEAAGRLPGVEARLTLAAPDAARLRVSSWFGTALDIGARGDTLAAYVPPRRTGMELDSAADSLGLAGPGSLAYRGWSASWLPPEGAWSDAARVDSLRVLRWSEGADSLALAVGGDGLPAWVEVWRGDGAPWRARYLAWTSVEGMGWPARIEFAGREGRVRVSCRVERAHLVRVPDRARVTVRIPEDAMRWTLGDLRRALERLGSL